jgi:hypothetical protein
MPFLRAFALPYLQCIHEAIEFLAVYHPNLWTQVTRKIQSIRRKIGVGYEESRLNTVFGCCAEYFPYIRDTDFIKDANFVFPVLALNQIVPNDGLPQNINSIIRPWSTNQRVGTQPLEQSGGIILELGPGQFAHFLSESHSGICPDPGFDSIRQSSGYRFSLPIYPVVGRTQQPFNEVAQTFLIPWKRGLKVEFSFHRDSHSSHNI